MQKTLAPATVASEDAANATALVGAEKSAEAGKTTPEPAKSKAKAKVAEGAALLEANESLASGLMAALSDVPEEKKDSVLTALRAYALAKAKAEKAATANARAAADADEVELAQLFADGEKMRAALDAFKGQVKDLYRSKGFAVSMRALPMLIGEAVGKAVSVRLPDGKTLPLPNIRHFFPKGKEQDQRFWGPIAPDVQGAKLRYARAMQNYHALAFLPAGSQVWSKDGQRLLVQITDTRGELSVTPDGKPNRIRKNAAAWANIENETAQERRLARIAASRGESAKIANS